MAREWVKLRTSILGHAGTMMLPAEAFRLWIVLLAMAGLADNDGRAGTVDEVAYNLHRTPDDTAALLALLNGRAEEREGQVYVRDWAEHQPLMDPTSAERQAKYRARKYGNTVSDERIRKDEVYERDGGICHICGRPASKTDWELDHIIPLARGGPHSLDNVAVAHAACNARKRDSLPTDAPSVTNVSHGPTRTRDTSNRREPSIQTEQQLTSGADAPHAHADDADGWEPFYQDCAALWGMTPRTGKDGVRAFVGQMTRMAATATGEDVAESRRLLRKWSESADFKFAHTPGLAPPKFGKWLQAQTCYSAAVER